MYTKKYASLLLFILPTIFFAISSQAADKSAWTEDKEMLLFFEAITKIRENALTQTTKQEIVRETLRSYLQETDPYSDYLTPEEYAGFKASQKSSYIGLGMEIERNSSGQIVCIPYPGSPAERSGIRFGDILEAINDVYISGKSLFSLVSMTRGEEGTLVVLTILRKENIRKKIKVKRTSVRSESVVMRWIDKIPVIQILSFTNTTQRELKYALADLKKTKPIVIDLRENPGGDLHSAIDAAMLLLEKDKKIVEIKKSDEIKSYKSLGNTVNSASPLYLWQNEHTASAAEVFIAALVQNERAHSIGKKTYGKGTTQEIIELSDGSALILTTGYLQTPDGTTYHGQGIEPALMLDKASPKTGQYLAKVKKFMKQGTLAKVSRKTKKKKPHDAKKQAPQIAVPAKLPDQKVAHFICFDKDFDTEEDVKIWASVVEKSLNKIGNQHSLQRNKPDGMKFSLCLGAYETGEEAEEQRLRVSKAMNIPMYIEVIKHDDINVTAASKQLKTGAKPDPVSLPGQ
ncbi:MAG: hypothetical protein B6245_04465 [Desulfobacteraceae bacterium 4572_88]|nr:MAG: hypothetical protein B6245_04465 [Desulfobacteraceae bacterium 4572_88]